MDAIDRSLILATAAEDIERAAAQRHEQYRWYKARDMEIAQKCLAVESVLTGAAEQLRMLAGSEPIIESTPDRPDTLARITPSENPDATSPRC